MTCPFAGPPMATGSVLGFETPSHSQILSANASAAGSPSAGAGPQRGGVTHYGTYLGIDALLSIQNAPAHAKPSGEGIMHHEEMTFVVVHQVFELWFKLIIFDLKKARQLLLDMIEGKSPASSDAAAAAAPLPVTLSEEAINQNFYLVAHLLSRVEGTLVHATNGFAVLETMHPSDFLEFRDYLVPASGFQSAAFRVLEGVLGVSDALRVTVNDKPVKDYLTGGEKALVDAECALPSVSAVLLRMLCHVAVPSNFADVFLQTAKRLFEDQQFVFAKVPRDDPKATQLIESNFAGVRSALDDPASWCDGLVLDETTNPDARDQFRRAFIAALFITSYRHDSRFVVVAQLLDRLIAVEEATLLWRGRHVHMAERMLGRRSGTGGSSSGVGYLDVTRKYRVFHLLWLVRRIAIRSSALPPLTTFTDASTLFVSQ